MRADTGLVVLETPANPTLRAGRHRARSSPRPGRPGARRQHLRHPGAAEPARPRRRAGAAQRDEVPRRARRRRSAAWSPAASEWAAALRRVRAVTGGLLHPLGAYLLHRGLATLPLRVRAQQESAQKIAAWLSTHPAVARVHYPQIAGLRPARPRRPPDARAGAMLALPAAPAATTPPPGSPAGCGCSPTRCRSGGVDSLDPAPGRPDPPPGAAGGAARRPPASGSRSASRTAEDLHRDLDQALAGGRTRAPSTMRVADLAPVG